MSTVTSKPTSVTYHASKPGETCRWHDDCCDPDDFGCPGNCQQPATYALEFAAYPHPTPLCDKHFAAAIGGMGTLN